jgi:hypothetical protein
LILVHQKFKQIFFSQIFLNPCLERNTKQGLNLFKTKGILWPELTKRIGQNQGLYAEQYMLEGDILYKQTNKTSKHHPTS